MLTLPQYLLVRKEKVPSFLYKEILENTINTRRKFEEDSMNLGIKDVSLSNQRRFKDVQ